MSNLELVTTEEATLEATQDEFELTLSELDMVGGGTIGSILG